MAGVGHLKRIWQDEFSVAGAVQAGLHFGASDLQFWEGDFA